MIIMLVIRLVWWSRCFPYCDQGEGGDELTKSVTRCLQVLTKVIRAKNTFMKKAAQRREEKEADLRAAENALTAAAVFKEKIGTKLNIL